MVNVMIENKKRLLEENCAANEKALCELVTSLRELSEIGNKNISLFVKKTRGEHEGKRDNARNIQ